MCAPTKEQYEAASRVWASAPLAARAALVKAPDSPEAGALREAIRAARGERG